MVSKSDMTDTPINIFLSCAWRNYSYSSSPIHVGVRMNRTAAAVEVVQENLDSQRFQRCVVEKGVINERQSPSPLHAVCVSASLDKTVSLVNF